MCDYTGHDFGAHYPDAACHEGYLWDLDGDGWIEGDYSHPCPKCNTAEYLDGAREDAESTEQGGGMTRIYSGAMIIEGAIKKARKVAPDEVAKWVKTNPTVNTFDWPNREATLRGMASTDPCLPKTLQTATI